MVMAMDAQEAMVPNAAELVAAAVVVTAAVLGATMVMATRAPVTQVASVARQWAAVMDDELALVAVAAMVEVAAV